MIYLQHRIASFINRTVYLFHKLKSNVHSTSFLILSQLAFQVNGLMNFMYP